ncbi:hypothetical protein VTL71DRAFT_9101 [Oculimacula yallundae]|uniref:Uncharacterized protein n=1 Tax=Oculimacula yallundae TaxID=86028 RepID=A0ABR4BTS4_9HELO
MPPAEETNHVYHLENSFASGIKKRPRGPRPRPIPTAQIPTSKSTPTSTKQTIKPLSSIGSALKVQAINYYKQNHLCTLEDAPELVKAVYDFPNILASLSDYPILDLAVTAIALATFSRANESPQAAVAAAETYHLLLQVTQQTIFSLDEQNIDISLLAIFFMGRYEQVVHTPVTHSESHPHRSQQLKLRLNIPLDSQSCIQSFSHHDGNLAILKSWKESSKGTIPATDVVKRVRRGMIRSALLRNIALPEWIRYGEDFDEEGLGLEYDRLIVHIVDIRQQLSGLEDERLKDGSLCPDSRALACQLDKEAQAVNQALQNWSTSFPDKWIYQRYAISEHLSSPTKDFYSSTVLNHGSLGSAAIWNLYFGTRILINSTLVQILDLSSLVDKKNKRRSEYLAVIDETANDLASSIPYCRQIITVVDSVDAETKTSKKIAMLSTEDTEELYVGVTSVWPLSMASVLSRVEIKQRSWFRAELARIGRMIYDTVLEGAEVD